MIHEPREELVFAALDGQLVLSERFPDVLHRRYHYVSSVLVPSSPDPVGYGRAQRGIVGYGRVGQGRVWHGMAWHGRA